MLKIRTLAEEYFQENFFYAKKTRCNTIRAFQYLADLSGNITIDRLDFTHLEKFRNWLLQSGRGKNTANIYLRSLSPVFAWAVQRQLVRVNPAVGVKQFKVCQKPIRVYTDAEFERLYRAAPSERWRAILLTARTTGLRRGELLNLTQDNIRQGFVFVEPKRETRTTWPWEPKDKEIRKVPLIKDAAILLSALSCYYPLLAPAVYDNCLRLRAAGVMSEDRRKCPDLNFERTWWKIQIKAFGRRIGSFHDLRRTYLTEMCDNLPEYFVLRLSGHSNSKTLQTYYTSVRESMFDTAREIASGEQKRASLEGSQPEKRLSELLAPTGRYRT